MLGTNHRRQTMSGTSLYVTVRRRTMSGRSRYARIGRKTMSGRNPYVGIGMLLCMLSLGCGGGGGTPTTPSTLELTSEPQAAEVGETSVTITWTTNLEADSQVDYGPTPDYGSTATAKTLVTNHSITLSQLAANRQYHFKVTSSDGTRNVTSADRTFTTLKDYAILISEGWTEFEGANYSIAETSFSDALEKQPTGAQATHGLAWAQALQDELETAATTFQTAITRGTTSADPLAGLAAVYRDIPDFDLAVENALAALALDADYQFAHNASFDYNDLHLILAQCYYAQAEYTLAQAQVDVLNPLNSLNPTNPTYVNNLLLEIESLGDIHGGW